jgi:hypothetical protein
MCRLTLESCSATLSAVFVTHDACPGLQVVIQCRHRTSHDLLLRMQAIQDQITDNLDQYKRKPFLLCSILWGVAMLRSPRALYAPITAGTTSCLHACTPFIWFYSKNAVVQPCSSVCQHAFTDWVVVFPLPCITRPQLRSNQCHVAELV